MPPKALYWVGTSLDDLRRLPDEARRALGIGLWRVQQGEEARDWKPMSAVGAGVIEIRVRAGGAFRLMYVAKFAEAIYVLHVFQKKSRKTNPLDIAVARSRLAAVRRGHHED